MMKKYLIYCVFAIAALGCQNMSKEQSSADIIDQVVYGDSTLASKIIKTADMKFRVKDVQNTKEKLSAVLKAEGGTIAEFSISSNIQRTEKVKHSTDSLLELISYRMEGVLLAKVPSEKLDDFTNKVAKMAVFVDEQSMKFDDQSLDYFRNELKSNNRREAALVIEEKKAKQRPADVGKTVEQELALKDEYVDQKIQNIAIDGRVQYSDISLSFYQDNSVKQIIVGNDQLSDYRPPFFQRVVLNLENGWYIFKEFILLLFNMWSILVLIAAGYFGFRYYKRRKKLI